MQKKYNIRKIIFICNKFKIDKFFSIFFFFLNYLFSNSHFLPSVAFVLFFFSFSQIYMIVLVIYFCWVEIISIMMNWDYFYEIGFFLLNFQI